MRFEVLSRLKSQPSRGVDIAYLLEDNWNDWWEFQTLYHLTYFDSNGVEHDIGAVKIGQFRMDKGQQRPDIPSSFTTLDQDFFSLGQDVEYYTSVMSLDDELAEYILNSLNDIVYNHKLYKKAITERVTTRSLLRSVSTVSIIGQFSRILKGEALLTRYKFEYYLPSPTQVNAEQISLSFQVVPNSNPPTNIHVLIGRNGVGKTYILNGMTRALATFKKDAERDGYFDFAPGEYDSDVETQFSSILSVSFSAFDNFWHPSNIGRKSKIIRHVNVGLRKRIKNNKDEWVTINKNPEDLADEFALSARQCIRGRKQSRWRNSLKTLEADPIFAEAEISNLVNGYNLNDNVFSKEARAIFNKLSSGHKIVLLTITKLVEQVEEKTLVLIDEPEAHLHPPLLSALVSALSDLLINRNGVAIIATHSPVVLQEVPTSCVWRIVRHGYSVRVSRPTIETFAENVDILTRDIFGLEITKSGYQKMLHLAAKKEENIRDVLDKLDFEVGSEGRALLSSIFALKNQNKD